MPRKLKVFRTPVGFHDAYVAAPSQKAALQAWGSDANLFARGVAEQVTDPKLMAEPLKRPGEVIKLSRGDMAAQLRALGTRKKKPRTIGKPPGRERTLAEAKPPPKRDRVEAAEAALRVAKARQASEAKELEAKRAAIDRQIESLRAKHGKETARLERARDKAREAYRAALAKWTA